MPPPPRTVMVVPEPGFCFKAQRARWIEVRVDHDLLFSFSFSFSFSSSFSFAFAFSSCLFSSSPPSLTLCASVYHTPTHASFHRREARFSSTCAAIQSSNPCAVRTWYV